MNTFMPWAGFKPTTLALKLEEPVHSLDSAGTTDSSVVKPEGPIPSPLTPFANGHYVEPLTPD
jgi:hypothetical protein